jgi:hypothetical protein
MNPPVPAKRRVSYYNVQVLFAFPPLAQRRMHVPMLCRRLQRFLMVSHLALSLGHVSHAVGAHDRLIAPRRLSRM